MADLHVSKKNIRSLLSLDDANTKGKTFIIPEYQRPYRWDKDTCDVLWTDFVNFYIDHKDDDKEYFLGSIVTCADSDNSSYIDIIDGQQRITSLLLLLRAFYYKLEKQNVSDPDDDDVKGLMQSIEPCIWKVNPMSKKVTDKASTHIKSLVATDDANEEFQIILESGEIPAHSNSSYAENYKTFLEKCNDYAQNALSGWKELCLFILERCIILPIECTDLDSALTIFGTLNNRGLALSDSDIFKAELYKLCKTDDEKKQFTNEWKQLEQTVEDGGFTLDDLFRYYMHVNRASRNITAKEIALRAFYAGEGSKFAIFKEPNFFKELTDLAEFWNSVYSYEDIYCEDEAKKYIHCLSYYPNEYWKYPVSVFFQVHKRKDDFRTLFTLYLKKLLAFMFARFIENPTVNAVRDKVFSFYVETFKTGTFTLDSYKLPDTFESHLKRFPTSKMAKGLLLLNAYLFDPKQTLLSGKLEIEHILPQRWQNTNYNGWDKAEAEKHIEMFGNKIIFEKRLNIQAGNGYFGKKKSDYYCKSKVHEVVALSKYPQNDWLKEDIEQREDKIIQRLMDFFVENINNDKKNTVLTKNLCFHLQSGQEEFKLNETCFQDGTILYELECHEIDMAKSSLTKKVFADFCISNEDPDLLLEHIGKTKILSGNIIFLDEKNDIIVNFLEK